MKTFHIAKKLYYNRFYHNKVISLFSNLSESQVKAKWAQQIINTIINTPPSQRVHEKVLNLEMYVQNYIQQTQTSKKSQQNIEKNYILQRNEGNLSDGVKKQIDKQSTNKQCKQESQLQLIKKVEKQIKSMFNLEGVAINDFYNQERFKFSLNPNQKLTFYVSPVTSKMFRYFNYNCSEMIIYGNRGVGKSMGLVLMSMQTKQLSITFFIRKNCQIIHQQINIQKLYIGVFKINNMTSDLILLLILRNCLNLYLNNVKIN